MSNKAQEKLETIFNSSNMLQRRPALNAHNESNISGVYVIGDLAGAPVIKLAMAQGFEVIQYIATKPDAKTEQPDEYDLMIVGAGAAGLNAALAAKDKGLRAVVLEKSKVANTIEDFPEGKWVYAEPDAAPPKGKLWLDGARKEDLLARWHQIVNENGLDVRPQEGIKSLERLKDRSFRVVSEKGEYHARRVVLATGQRGNPRKLGVAGEEQEWVYHRLYSPRHYKDEDILVVGAGNSAVEAALTLSEHNRVRLCNRGGDFPLIFKGNAEKLKRAVAARKIEVMLKSQVQEFGDKQAVIEIEGNKEAVTVPCDHAFVLIGAELPVKFLKSLGLKLENEWTGSLARAAALTLITLAGLWILGGHAELAGSHLGSLPRWLGALVALAGLGALVFYGRRGDRYSWLGVSF